MFLCCFVKYVFLLQRTERNYPTEMQFFFIYCGGIVQLVTSRAISEYRLIKECFPPRAELCINDNSLVTIADAFNVQIPPKIKKKKFTFRVMNATLHWTSHWNWCCFDRDIEMKVRILNSFVPFEPTCFHSTEVNNAEREKTRIGSIICEI